jgi:biopolymer transport protein ExbD
MADNNDLLAHLKKVAVLTPQPQVHIRGDGRSRFEFVGRVVTDCQRAGIFKVGFITEPPPRGG